MGITGRHGLLVAFGICNLGLNIHKMDVSFLFYTHTDNRDLWPILYKSIASLPKENAKFFAVNFSDVDLIDPCAGQILTYNDSELYSQKLEYLLKLIPTKYVVLIHDNDLITEFDIDLFKSLVIACEKNDIDRCIFGVAAKDAPNRLCLQDDHFIGQINHITSPHFLLPYDVSPSIWKTSSYLRLLSDLSPTHYRDIERSPIVERCKKDLKMYGFLTHSLLPSKYVIGRPFYPKFSFLHIFCSRMLMEREMYMDQIENFDKIMCEFPVIASRATLRDQTHINVHFRTV